MDEWKTIDSAPKDGKRVLVAEQRPVRDTSIARWVGSPHDVWIADRGNYIRHPTHWMRLPEPPST